ncbi:ribosomal protein S18 acetylase RimI-like enzyme [Neobacillus cucumis]|nr:hypothetical protein [Neobacillus cucumis]MBM7650921.1 ribosomal protein S18 acetylase RimI-like enzyme [Neobacillus cucumis]
MSDWFLNVSYRSDFDEDLNFIDYRADLNLLNIETEDHINIGHASFLLYNTYHFNDWLDVVFSGDGLSGDAYEVLDVLTGFRETEEIYGLIIILNTLKIDEKFQMQGWGSIAMEEFLKYWSYIGAEYLALKPAPLESNIGGLERKKYIKRLTEFYKRFGFKILKTQEREELCMGKNLTYL